jgi:hypothetical protein
MSAAATVPPNTSAEQRSPTMKNTLRLTLKYAAFFWLCAVRLSTTVIAEPLMNDNFESQPQARWSYVSDQVMGGISQGQLAFVTEQDESFAHMSGQVSTENNGGFIQFRTSIPKGSTATASGVTLKVRGNSQQYYIHLRSSGTLLPWQYYQAGFQANDEWQTINIPLKAFAASGKWLRKQIKPGSIRSIGVVAFGRDHSADIQVAEIGFY